MVNSSHILADSYTVGMFSDASPESATG